MQRLGLLLFMMLIVACAAGSYDQGSCDNSRCKEKGGFCVGKPFKKNCKDGKIIKRLCKGNKCACCIPPDNRCDSDFEEWIVSDVAMSYKDAEDDCNKKRLKLACPEDQDGFYKFLQSHGEEDYWYAGQQGTGIYFNYMYWDNGKEIARVVEGFEGTPDNLWIETSPKYAQSGTFCVKGNKKLDTEDCTKTFKYFCSPNAMIDI